MRKLPKPSRFKAAVSGVILGFALALMDEIKLMANLSPEAWNVVFAASLVLFFFAPMLFFVAGIDYFSFGYKDMLKKPYWQSLGAITMRAFCWLVGTGISFALLAAVQGN